MLLASSSGPYFRLAIGSSIQSFERKMEQAETQLGRSVVVQYQPESALVRVWLGATPFLLLSGLMMWGVRLVAGGSGGGGSSGAVDEVVMCDAKGDKTKIGLFPILMFG